MTNDEGKGGEHAASACSSFWLRHCFDIRHSSFVINRRESDANRRAAARLALGLNAAAVELRNMFHNRQPQPSAAELATARFVRAIESFEDPRQILTANSNSVIAHAQRDRIAATVRRKADLAISIRILHRVIEQI